MTQASAEAAADHRQPTIESSIEVVNPATGERIASVPAITPPEVARLAARARHAQPEWEALGFAGRARVLRRAQRWIIEHADKVARTIVSESGKTYEDAQLAEVAYGAAAFGFWAKRAPRYLADKRVRSRSPMLLGRKLVVRRAPIGVVGVIGPWNYPLTNSFGDCIPALAAGNSVLLKPASLTPLTSLLMARMLDDCGLPSGVFQVLVGDGAVGSELIDHVDFVMFTGSTEVGKKVLQRAAGALTPVGLELGGKDPMIVLRDANLERAANSAVYYAMQNSGQTCISIDRAYVEAPVYGEFLTLVTKKIEALRQGVPADPGSVEVGAITSPAQLDLIQDHIDDATDKGARLILGGRRSNSLGSFFAPTLLTDVDHSMRCMTEETFGPTLPVMKVDSPQEAIRLANDARYGLQASIWTGNRRRGRRLARQLEAGVVTINDAQVNYVALELPMGGWKESGLGSRHGADGIRKFTKQQSVVEARLTPKRELHMFPYRERSTKMLGRLMALLYGRQRRS